MLPTATAAELVDPETLERQKRSYLLQLEEQLQGFTKSLEEQRRQHLETMRANAEQQKVQLIEQLNRQVLQKELMLEHQFTEKIVQLNQQFYNEKNKLEQQAIKLAGEYQQKRMKEDAMRKQVLLSQEHAAAERHLAEGLKALTANPAVAVVKQPPPRTGGSYVPPPTTMPSCVPPQTMSSSYTPAPVTDSCYVPAQTVLPVALGTMHQSQSALDEWKTSALTPPTSPSGSSVSSEQTSRPSSPARRQQQANFVVAQPLAPTYGRSSGSRSSAESGASSSKEMNGRGAGVVHYDVPPTSFGGYGGA
jgi:hypothetical protein